MSKVFIDVGHGNLDCGAFANGIKEKDINLTVCLKLKELLVNSGFEVMLSRDDDTVNPSLYERCVMANQWGADIFVSIHHNAGGGKGYDIIHTIYNGRGRDLAYIIGAEFDKIQTKHGIYSKAGQYGDYYAVIRDTAMPAIITEFAFIDNPEDAKMIDSEEKLYKEAEVIYTGICKFYGIEPVIDKPVDDYKAKYEDLLNGYYRLRQEVINLRDKADEILNTFL